MNIPNTIRVFTLYLLAACVPQQLPAQQPGSTTLRGEITGAPAIETRWQVELRAISPGNANEPVQRTFPDINGHFVFPGLRAGNYEVTLVSVDQRQLARELAQVSEFSAPLQLRYRAAAGGGAVAAPGVAAAVSLKRLQHNVPKAARKLYQQGRKHRDARRFAEAEAAYRAALSADSEYLEAANDLGVLYYMTGRYADSLAILEQARGLDAGDVKVLSNLGASYLALGRYAEAETPARQAYQSDTANVRHAYLLGLSLVGQGRADRETRTLLEASAEAIPHARLALARVLALNGDRGQAHAQLARYLEASPAAPPAKRGQVEQWMKALR
ncbi:MAG: tetratricopeptide repeat protein [Bryobacterales bacterium]|nr:tetratricopeptide repeat protein [Bryobacterales bacterium]